MSRLIPPAPTPSITPLPLRVQPQPGEALSSFLSRSAHAMLYPRVNWLLQPEQIPSPITSHNLELLTQQDDYAFLCALLALSQDQVYAMTLHSFDVLSLHLRCFSTPHTTPPTTSPHASRRMSITPSTPINRPLVSIQTHQFTCLPAQTTQVCPLCLQQSVAYDRLSWKIKYLITCPTHHLLLLRCCPRCQRPIRSTRVNPLACQQCHHSFASDSLPLPDDALFLLHGDLLTLRALGLADSLSLTDTYSALQHDPRACLPFAQYLALLRALSLAMRPLSPSTFQTLLPSTLYSTLTRLQRNPLSPQERLPSLHIATIHWIFSQWPDHFFTFLSALQTQTQRLRLPNVAKTLSSLHAPDAYCLLSTTPPSRSRSRSRHPPHPRSSHS